MLCHFQSRMAQQLLKRKSITTAINQIFAGECMSEQMDACFIHTSFEVVFGDCLTQCVLRHHFSVFCWKQIIHWPAATDNQILPQDTNHNSTKRNDLNFTAFGMTENNLTCFKIQILDADVADSTQ